VKADSNDPLDNSATKLKKSKCADSPDRSVQDSAVQGSGAINTPTRGTHRHQPIDPPAFADSTADGGQWGSETVRFRQPSQRLCLWANAAFNYMHRLQWQNQIGPSTDGFSDMGVFQCPECQATYSSKPVHQSDCDLALLLEQTGALR